jgi:hypothetical protein
MVKGFICVKTGERLPFAECLECARSRLNRKLDCPFDEGTIEGMIRHIKDKKGISVTMISGCHRAIFLQRHHDYFVRPGQLYWAFRGQIAHAIMEESTLHKDAVREKEFSKTWEGIKITGTPDLIIPSQKVLKDYKTTKAVPEYLNKDGRVLAWENHRVQLNLYRWLIPHEIDAMEVVYFSMMDTLICPVDAWPDEPRRKSDMTADRYLEENLVPLSMALESGTLPPYARTWACDKYCGMADLCYQELKKEIAAARRVVPLKKKGAKNGKSRRKSASA